jgi:hypothetical protein
MTNEEEQAQQKWSIPKILTGIVILGVLGWFVYQNRSYILSINDTPTKSVAGAQTSQKQEDNKRVAIPQFDLQQKVQEISQEVGNLDVKEVAASSPQVQKVLKDMQSLKDLPASQAKDACMKICSGL